MIQMVAGTCKKYIHKGIQLKEKSDIWDNEGGVLHKTTSRFGLNPKDCKSIEIFLHYSCKSIYMQAMVNMEQDKNALVTEGGFIVIIENSYFMWLLFMRNNTIVRINSLMTLWPCLIPSDTEWYIYISIVSSAIDFCWSLVNENVTVCYVSFSSRWISVLIVIWEKSINLFYEDVLFSPNMPLLI